MAQVLLLGLGGTGSRIVNNVAADLKKKQFSINDGQICCAVLDTNENDNEKVRGTGVGVPVIPTSKDREIKDYLKMYSNRGVRSWMPESPGLLKESMEDGASQIRSKSRLAFFDILADGTIHQLETQINKLFDYRDGAKIRVLIVSSLAGGTGSGMFIQTALWLRKYFAKRKCTVTIRGIFVLPDAFISTIEDIRKDDTEIQSLYANAYGAIRELNAITKIKTKGLVPLLPVKIDDLFDSEKDLNDGQPVYDYAFFIDDISEGGSVLTQIDHYEQVAARLVYMQLFAPMHTDLYSEEDNLFKRFQKSEEPVFGSCGTAKAIYPTEDVLRYCALRAAQDSLSTGWRKIDAEIEDKKRKEDEREQNGVVLKQRVEPRGEYVRLFEAKSGKTGDQIGTDRLFVSIANDVKNEENISGEDGVVTINYTDKVDDLIKKLDEIIAKTIDTANPGGLSELKLKSGWAEQTTDTRDTLHTLVDKKKRAVERFIEDVGESVGTLAEEVLDLVCPSDMGDINPENTASILGFLTKKDKNNETYFIHPIAVRYLLYKLEKKLDEIKITINLDKALECAEKGYGNGKQKISFDNPKTRNVEDDAISYLQSKALFQNEGAFIKTFKSLYVQHNKGQVELCRAYAIAALKVKFAALLSQRLEKLTVIVENFFKDLVKVSNSLKDDVSANVRKNSQTTQKTIYVCASGEEKEALYKSLHFNTGKSDADINKIIARALYGRFCSEESPNAENNKPYKGKSVTETFFREVVSTYSKLILASKRDDVDLDIYSAICKSADVEYAKEQAAMAETESESERLDVDLDADEISADDKRHQRHVAAMEDMVKKLSDLGAPFLISDEEQPEDASEHLSDADESETEDDGVFTPIKKRKTFWGFHPLVAENCPELATILGVDITKQQNRAYAKNEFDCYRAVYGIQAGYVEKFNELKRGIYYTNYCTVVRDMIAEVGKGNTDALIHTPHLDKTWHLFLPYITPEMQSQEDCKFYRSFWLALAYGLISIGSDGKFRIARTKQTSTGHYQKNEPLTYNGDAIGKVDVLELLAALKIDGSFMLDAARLEKKFKEECAKLDHYEGTEFLRGRTVKETTSKTEGGTVKTTIGGLASKQDNNAVTIIVRYHNSPRQNDAVTVMLIQSLEQLCRDLVTNKYELSEQDKIRNKGFELCKRIYDAAAMKDKDFELIDHWKEAWSKNNSDN